MGNRKASAGRKKIAIEKISKKNHLQVTFSKRKAGLFKKASELCTLCGVEIAIVVFSPAQKAFSFGHPEVDSIVDRFLTRNPPQSSSRHQLIEAHRNVNVGELNVQLTQILNEIEAEREIGEVLTQIRKASQRQCWWESPIEELEQCQLEQLRDAMKELKKRVKANQISLESTNSLPFLGAHLMGNVGNFESKKNYFAAGSIITHAKTFGHGHGIF